MPYETASNHLSSENSCFLLHPEELWRRRILFQDPSLRLFGQKSFFIATTLLLVAGSKKRFLPGTSSHQNRGRVAVDESRFAE